MNQASPETTTEKLQKRIIPYWNSKEQLNEFEFKRLEREINGISSYAEKHTTLAMLYAVQNKNELMIQNFEKSLSAQFSLNVIANYSSSLFAYGYLEQLKELLYEYRHDLNSSSALHLLINIAVIYLDIDMVKFSYQKANELKYDEQAMMSLTITVNKVLEALDVTSCTKLQLNLLVGACSDVIRKHNAILKSYLIELVDGAHYVFGIESDNLDLIVAMNAELAEKISQTSQLNGCKLVAVFKSCKNEQ